LLPLPSFPGQLSSAVAGSLLLRQEKRGKKGGGKEIAIPTPLSHEGGGGRKEKRENCDRGIEPPKDESPPGLEASTSTEGGIERKGGITVPQGWFSTHFLAREEGGEKREGGGSLYYSRGEKEPGHRLMS